MIISDAGREIVMRSEGKPHTEAYQCPGGRWTIGYGHTGDVHPGDKITLHQAEVLLEFDLETAEEAVARLAPKANANQASAMISLVFNIGVHAFETSTLLKHFHQGAIQAAAAEFPKWTHVKGKELPGLVKRRAAERALFLQVPS